MSGALESGRYICQKIRSSEAPSRVMASGRLFGMRMKNCRKRKMLKALPKNVGTQSGFRLPIQPSAR
jgi:hypothetical protein